MTWIGISDIYTVRYVRKRVSRFIKIIPNIYYTGTYRGKSFKWWYKLFVSLNSRFFASEFMGQIFRQNSALFRSLCFKAQVSTDSGWQFDIVSSMEHRSQENRQIYSCPWPPDDYQVHFGHIQTADQKIKNIFSNAQSFSVNFKLWENEEFCCLTFGW